MPRVLCVAEKPSISKAVAGHLSGGTFTTRNTRDVHVKNYSFNYDFGPPLRNCDVTMTCVKGHLTNTIFPPEYDDWKYPPPERLFGAPVETVVEKKCTDLAKNIEDQARYASVLIIWTDCDREGEHIGSEIRDAARKGNARISVKRARFSNIERAYVDQCKFLSGQEVFLIRQSHILAASRALVSLDEKQVDAVSARIELDLRIGYAFTRLLCLTLQPLGGVMTKRVISYGSCQFPALGFVVDRYFRVKNFVPETFWSIKVMHERDRIKVNFSWARNRLFDRISVIILYERCLAAKKAEVTKVEEKPTSKWKPLPLTTVEMQKMATRFLRMTGQQTMKIAEDLYSKGFISYPRTETDRFDKGINLRALVQKQTQDNRWGPFAQNLVDGAFQQPRQGRHDDKAHPPIHPITYAAPTALNVDERKVYELVTRRFLACCSEDARGVASDVEILYGDENFKAHGVIVTARNYLDVYPYENWTGTVQLPRFIQGEQFEPTEALITEGKTTGPSFLTEADLIALMDANGIGTDATMADHIEKIQDRQYVETIDRGGAANQAADNQEEDDGGGRGRGGRGGARGGRGGGRGGGGAARGGRRGGREFIPTSLGVALIEGFDRMHFETSLGKPFLRKEMELKMRAICEGRTNKRDVLQESLHMYRNVFNQSVEELELLRAACRQYVFQQGAP